ncbi:MULTISPECIES: DUF418 domain-containing protein [Bacillus cereus group]|uniref:DUF418 domain-containing protein n=1 Tax=Bacillus cereus group TaxID=86661 RepID=UPI000871E773|nr:MULTISPECIES: DUF418 domain-containing protein [Bacillus cereus group]OFD00139.1 hypothetical protein BTGOE5_21340 [Bacillus thuringiensis]MBJ8048506.1 DUF418 domain-containing protein [Bacillus cereus group sp. N18]OFD07926.1 hypothetical protein BTGOE7_22430 [Bacillus thuringiensis]PDZ82825.1 DUF418 domain-containing protein [Bacillus toyonensis]PEA69247.1 DUF418 domain-containing protein [Bacillus toyonensis]
MDRSINDRTIEKRRAVSLDLARGTMLLLIVLAHAPLYLYAADPGIMHRVESSSFFDQIVNLFGIFIIDNRARAMFAVLLGYGLVLAFEGQISKGKNEIQAVKIVRKRSLYLILFGIVLAVLIGGQDILMAYGLAGIFVSPLLKCKMKTLIRTFIIIAILYTIFIPIIWGLNMQSIGDYGFSPDVSAKDTYLSTTMIRLLFFPIIPVLIHFMFPILPSVILGLWIAKYKLLIKPEQQLKKLYFITTIGLAISLIGALPLSFIGTIWYPTVFTAGMINGIHILTGIAGGLAYATGFGIIGSRLKNPGYFSLALIALGKRSLTFFVLNEALLVIFLSPVAFDLGGHVSNAFAALIAICIWISSVIVALIMEKNNLNGPLEILLRRLVYKK